MTSPSSVPAPTSTPSVAQNTQVTAAQAATTNAVTATMATVGNMGQLHAAAPQVEHAMLISLAFNITTKMQHDQETIKEIQEEADRDEAGS